MSQPLSLASLRDMCILPPHLLCDMSCHRHNDVSGNASFRKPGNRRMAAVVLPEPCQARALPDFIPVLVQAECAYGLFGIIDATNVYS